MKFEEWEATVPGSIKRESLWQFEVYPKTLFLYDMFWQDSEQLMKEIRGRAIIEQLVRSVGSICANIEEGFGRGFGAEYAYFLRIALGSARETRGWYYRAHHLLSVEVLECRLKYLDEIIGALVQAVAYQKTPARSKH